MKPRLVDLVGGEGGGYGPAGKFTSQSAKKHLTQPKIVHCLSGHPRPMSGLTGGPGRFVLGLKRARVQDHQAVWNSVVGHPSTHFLLVMTCSQGDRCTLTEGLEASRNRIPSSSNPEVTAISTDPSF